MRKPISLCLATLLLTATVSGQAISRNQRQQDDRIVTGTNLVTVNVIVTDGNGQYVPGLSENEFTVYDNKMKQQIAHFSSEPAALSIGIVCEVHESTPAQTREMLAAVKQFTSTLRSDDDFFFTAFSEHGSLTTDFIPSTNQILDHLQGVRPGGPSSLYDSVYAAATRLRKARNLKRALLVFSDGYDTNSERSYRSLRNDLRTLDAQVYAIGIIDPVLDQLGGTRRWFFEDITREAKRRSIGMTPEVASGRAVLAEMSRVSGGSTYLPETESEAELAYICSQIALELRQQYTLTFYSRAAVTNEWHTIKVQVRESQARSNLRLSYRKGYQLKP
jgi:Ca-activated chloride channel family protein